MSDTATTWTNNFGDTLTVGANVVWSRRPRVRSNGRITGVCDRTGRPVIEATDLFDSTATDTYVVDPQHLRDQLAFWNAA